MFGNLKESWQNGEQTQNGPEGDPDNDGLLELRKN